MVNNVMLVVQWQQQQQQQAAGRRMQRRLGMERDIILALHSKDVQLEAEVKLMQTTLVEISTI